MERPLERKERVKNEEDRETLPGGTECGSTRVVEANPPSLRQYPGVPNAGRKSSTRITSPAVAAGFLDPLELDLTRDDPAPFHTIRTVFVRL